MPCVSGDVDIDLEAFDDEDLIRELKNRGINIYDIQEIEKIYNNYCFGKPIDNELRQLFWKTLGRIV